MAVEDIIRRIDKETTEKADSIIESAKVKASRMAQEAEKQMREEARKALEEVARRTAGEKKSAIALRKVEEKKKLLSKKRDIMRDAFEAAFEGMNNMPEEQYREFLVNLICASAEPGTGTVYIGKKDRQRAGSGLEEELKRTLRQKDINAEYKLAVDDGIESGFVIKAGSISVNGRSEVFREYVREKMESEIARILFE